MTGRTPSHPIASLFVDRWSPRAYAADPIPDEVLMTAFEAARWAPSSFNAQPWRFIYAKRGGPGWDGLLGALAPFNQMWASKAAALVLFISKTTLIWNGAEMASPTHSFDTGAAWGSFALQTSLLGWSAHGMAGFDRDKAREAARVPEGYAIEMVAAIGKIGDPADLPEQFRAREAPSDRQPLADLVMKDAFAQTVDTGK